MLSLSTNGMVVVPPLIYSLRMSTDSDVFVWLVHHNDDIVMLLMQSCPMLHQNKLNTKEISGDID